MRDKLVLRFLGFLETIKYILEQSHGVPPVSVALDHTTLKEEGSCGYSSVKTVRSIDQETEEIIAWLRAATTIALLQNPPPLGQITDVFVHEWLGSRNLSQDDIEAI